jgi:NAD(P)-dependent dehydrogenase (short-subunit alcohol dehydrogenase family)
MNFEAQAAFLKNKVILVTGAGNGIGAAVSKSVASYGANVILLDKSIPALEKVYDAILEMAPHTDPSIYPLDLKGASNQDYDVLIASIEENYGRLDGLIHCAATLGQISPVEHQDVKTWAESLHVNLTAPYLLTKASLNLLESSQGRVIFTTDSNQAKAYQSAYGIAKSGIETLTKQLASEYESEARIRFHCIDPGTVRTDLFSRAYPGIDPTDLPSAESVCDSYLFLLSEESHHTNGDVVKA